MKSTQRQKILTVLQSLQSGDHTIPEEYLRRVPQNLLTIDNEVIG